MSKEYSYTIKTQPEEVFKVLKSKIAAADGIELKGNSSAGNLKGKGFEASYTMQIVDGKNVVTLKIDKKPFYVPWSMIESKIDSEVKKW
jgi:outer membrane receptor for ferrienterochelin and colicin